MVKMPRSSSCDRLEIPFFKFRYIYPTRSFLQLLRIRASTTIHSPLSILYLLVLLDLTLVVSLMVSVCAMKSYAEITWFRWYGTSSTVSNFVRSFGLYNFIEVDVVAFTLTDDKRTNGKKREEKPMTTTKALSSWWLLTYYYYTF